VAAAIDIVGNVGTALKTAEKDERRIAMFLAACAKKSSELKGTPTAQAEFAEAAALHIAGWWHAVTHLQFPKDLFGDPLKGKREEVRAFAKLWKLDPAFIKAMG